MTARPDSQCRASVVTKSENSVRTPYVSFTLGQTLGIPCNCSNFVKAIDRQSHRHSGEELAPYSDTGPESNPLSRREG